MLCKILAVLDTGSSSTIIDSGFAKHHRLPVLAGPYTKKVMYIDRSASYETSEVEVVLIGQDTKFRQKVTAQTVQGFSKSCYLHDWHSELSKFQHFGQINTTKAPYPPLGTLLIGCDQAHLFEVLESRKGQKGDPIANRTPLGWAFLGPRDSNSPVDDKSCFVDSSMTFKSQDDFLAQLVTRQFELETFGLQEQEAPFSKGFSGGPKDPVDWSPGEKLADTRMTVLYNSKGQFFTIKIPFCDDHHLNLEGNF